MSDSNMAAKLKARLSEWQGYIEQSHPTRQPPEVEEAAAPSQREETHEVSGEPQPAIDVSDSLIERYETRIADLRDALEQERAHACRLADELAREKTLNAYAHPHQASGSPRRVYRPLRDHRFDAQEARSTLLWLLIIVLAVSGLCILVAFAILH